MTNRENRDLTPKNRKYHTYTHKEQMTDEEIRKHNEETARRHSEQLHDMLNAMKAWG